MSALDADNNRQQVQCLASNQAQEMLGVFIAPDGNHKEQFQNLLSKAKFLGERNRTIPAYSHEAWTGLTHIAMKSLEYCLPSTNLTKSECTTIMWELLRAFLPKAGINRYIKRDVLYASPKVQGLGLKNLYLVQGIHHVSDLCENIWKQLITGQFQMTSLEYMRLELGVNDHILNTNYDSLCNLVHTESWMEKTWKFMSEHKITIDVDPPKVPIRQQNDIPLMEIILASPNITPHEIKTVNKCRLYLQIFQLSDMVTGCGKFIKDSAWNCIRDSHNKDSSTKWPLIPPPSKGMIKIWQSVLRQSLCIIKYQKLDVPLGKWFGMLSHWTWFLGKDVRYSRDYKNVVRKHKVIGGTPRRRRYSKKGKRIKNEQILGTTPTTVSSHQEHFEAKGLQSVLLSPIPEIAVILFSIHHLTHHHILELDLHLHAQVPT